VASAIVPRYKETRAWSWARRSWIGGPVRAFRSLPREFFGWAKRLDLAVPDVACLDHGIAALSNRCSLVADEIPDTEAPIFLLSTGWRAGSTLLQRILVTDQQLLVWGEPFGEMTPISRIARMVADSLSPRDLQLWYKQSDATLASLTTSWIATLSPPGDDFRSGLRSLFVRWLGDPARRLGFGRWGLKEVRLGAAEASLLHWLFPQAKFIFLSRHPYDCYRSFSDSGWGHLYCRHPEVCVDSIAGFARHWNRLALSWSELPQGFPYVHIRYEDMTSGKVDFRHLESWLGIQIREDRALSASIGGTAVRSRINWFERFIISREASQGMRVLGYSR